MTYVYRPFSTCIIVSDIAIFVLERNVKHQLTNFHLYKGTSTDHGYFGGKLVMLMDNSANEEEK